MTSNQIAYASNLEANRHNEVTEAETERHNKAMESLQDEANAIQQQHVEYEAAHQYRMDDLQKQYNQWFAKFTEANEGEKRQIDQRLADIKQQMNDETVLHNRTMEDLSYIEADIKDRAQKETATYNSFLKAQALAQQSMEWWFKDKQLDYQDRMLEEQSGYWNRLTNLESHKISNDWVLNQRRITLGWAELGNKENQTMLTFQKNIMDFYELKQQMQLRENADIRESIRTGIEAADVVFRGVGNVMKLFP